MNIRSRLAILSPGEVLEDAVVRVDGIRIAEVGRASEFRKRGESIDLDLGESILLPGLINAHCHLDYTILRGALLGPDSFSGWIQRLNAIRSVLSTEDLVRSIRDGFQQLARHGVTTVANIESYPEVFDELEAPPIRTYWFYELIDVRQNKMTERLIESAVRMHERNPGWMGGVGLSPHSPYTASLELYRLASQAAQTHGLPVTTHLGESYEEALMFGRGDGPLFEFMRKIGREMEDCGPGRPSPLRHLAKEGILRRDWLVAHLNEIAPEDWELLEPGGLLNGLTVVHCPQSHEFFGHRPFELSRLVGCGARVCLGTDSLASGRELSLFREMALAWEYHPRVRPRVLLEMVTTWPAAALGLEGKAGVIRSGAYADLTAVAYEGHSEGAHSALCDLFLSSHFTMCAGQVVFESHAEKSGI